MRLRFIFIVGIITGYILGARAGRSSYVQLKAKATEAWEDPRVQKAVADTQEFVKEKTPIVAEKVTEGAKIAGEKLSESAKVAAENIGATTERVVDSARIAGTSVAEGAKVAMDNARETAEKIAEGAKDAAEKLSTSAKSTARTLADKVTGGSDEAQPTNDATGVGAPKE